MLNNLICNINSTPHKVPLPFNRDYRPDVLNIDSIIFVSVAKNYVRNPNGTHLVRTCFNLVFLVIFKPQRWIAHLMPLYSSGYKIEPCYHTTPNLFQV